MIVFFDIDATLIKTQGVGLRALVQAGQELFGPSFTDQGVEVAGRLDPLIIADMLRQCGLPHEGRVAGGRRVGGRRRARCRAHRRGGGDAA